MKNKLEDFELDQLTGVHVIHGVESNEISYSDGSRIEEEIFAYINSSKDKSTWSQELINRIIDWPTEYHFSPLRHNLLRHFSFKDTDHILELGCGCGAITRQLGESGAQVTSIDGTLQRARSAAARCTDLPNVKVYQSNFQNINFEQHFDYVLLIGVLEYAPKFFQSENPIVDCLLLAKRALKYGGKLIIAIENRMGLKYFNGLNEDHVGKPYFGIEDLYTEDSVQTFGKHELECLLKSTGFDYMRFQYPFPDYKLPEVIIDDAALSLSTFNCVELIRFLRSREYPDNFKTNFSEFMVWKTVCDNQLLGDLANSFLVVASPEKQENWDGLLAIKYTVNRKKQYNTRTTFFQSGTSIQVEKSLLHQINPSSDSIFIHKLGIGEYYSGPSLRSLIREKALKQDFDGVVLLIKQWIQYLVDFGLTEKVQGKYLDTPLLPNFIDCLPANIIVSNGAMRFIDQEWIYNKPFTIKTLFLRFCLNEIYRSNDDGAFKNFLAKSVQHSQGLLFDFARIFDIHLDERALQKELDVFNDIAEIIYGNKRQETTAFLMGQDGQPNKTKRNLMQRIRSKVRSVILRMIG